MLHFVLTKKIYIKQIIDQDLLSHKHAREKITKENKINYLGKLFPNILRKVSKDMNNNMIDIKKLNIRYLIITRHGERIDSSSFRKNQVMPKEDPELSVEGMSQAINIDIQ